MTTTTAARPRPTAASPAATARPIARRARRRFSLGRAVAWAYIVIVLFVTIFPFYWILRTALSNNYSLITDPASLVPTGFTLGAFQRVLGLATPEQAIAEGGSGASIEIGHFLLNSVIYATPLDGADSVLLGARRLRLRPTALARPGAECSASSSPR